MVVVNKLTRKFLNYYFCCDQNDQVFGKYLALKQQDESDSSFPVPWVMCRHDTCLKILTSYETLVVLFDGRLLILLVFRSVK